MHLHKIAIQNFRQLELLEEEFCPGINIIVGRNGVGKSNVLEAIRLAKALLCPRTQSESAQALMSLNAMTPHNQQLIVYEAIAGDPEKPVLIECTYTLSHEEIASIEKNARVIATDIVKSRIGPQPISTIAAFFSSPQGQAETDSAHLNVLNSVTACKAAANTCRVSLRLTPTEIPIQTEYPEEAMMVAFLDRSAPFNSAKFTYFPADRALPRGEVPIQLGSQDATQTLESHNSQPHTKYGRLKNMIFNTIIASPDGRDAIKRDFKLIFDTILPGLTLEDPGVSQHGSLSIRVRRNGSGRSYDIDQLSSGEKSLILSFLIMMRGLEKHSVVLMDEPELHLHPAVCKELVPFVEKHLSKERDVQLIGCSHSPEVLSGAFAREGCRLYNLVDGKTIAPVEPSNKPFIEETLRSLGISETEGLLYKSIVSVEGQNDADLLEAGFPTLFQSYKVKPRGGKNDVLAAMKKLKSLEHKGELNSTYYFIFDRDDKPSAEQPTARVKLLEWDRYCIENYLIDASAIFRVLCDKAVSSSPPTNSGEVKRRLRDLALRQIDDRAMVRAFKSLGIPQASFELADFVGKDLDDAWTLIQTVVAAQQEALTAPLSVFETNYLNAVAREKQHLANKWQSRWHVECDGKKLFADAQAEFDIRTSPINFKMRIMGEMRTDTRNPNWQAWKSTIERFLF